MSNTDFAGAFESLKTVFAPYESRLTVKANTSKDYLLVSRRASPFKQHKGEPLFFGSVRMGKAYVSFHFLPLYMCSELSRLVTPALKKRMQGNACFNFKAPPEPSVLSDLQELTRTGLQEWTQREWV